MEENKVQKCRTCLKNTIKNFPLTKKARGCTPKTTYYHIIKEYAKIESSIDYEHLMPQYLCFLCGRELRSIYNFIRQAQCCNIKLINVISKQLDCLQEKTIDLPHSANDIEVKSLDIKTEKDISECNTKDPSVQDLKTDEISIENATEPLKSEELFNNELSSENYKDEVDNDNGKQTDTHNLHLECCPTTVLNKKDNELQPTESHIEKTLCPICNRIFSRRDNLLTHMRTQHDIETPNILLQQIRPQAKEVFECKECPSKYTNKYSLLYHLKNKHGINEKKDKEKRKDKIIKCRSCDYTARTYSALNYHNRSKHGSEEDKFKCKFCSYICLKKFDLLKHMKKSHKKLIRTLKAEAKSKEEEQREFSNTATKAYALHKFAPQALHVENISLDENEESSSSDDNICSASKLNKGQTNSHFNIQIAPEDREELSDEEFLRNILNIKKRQIKSQSSKSLARRCNICGNIYRNYKALYTHQRDVHISEDKYSLCPHCGKKYKRKADLRTHIEKTHKAKNPADTVKQPAKVREKRFMCTECSYVCTTITILNIHRNRHHTGEKPFKCDICFKSFIVPYDLKIHRYLHTGERPYKCPICSKGFRDNSHMIKHKRIHSSERPYKCKECGKSFTQSYNLSVHRRTHLKEKKLNCIICAKVFENISLLNMHRMNENHHDEVI